MQKAANAAVKHDLSQHKRTRPYTKWSGGTENTHSCSPCRRFLPIMKYQNTLFGRACLFTPGSSDESLGEMPDYDAGRDRHVERVLRAELGYLEAAVAGIDICDVQGTYQLLSNPSVGVEWTLESAYEFDGTTPLPAGAVTVTPSGKVTFNDIIVPGNEEENRIYNGIFTFKATAVGCTHTPKCTAKMVLRRGINTSDSGCSDPIYNKKGAEKYALSEDTHDDPSGSLISISDIKDNENILDDNFNNCATYTGGLSLASNIQVIGVKTQDGSDFATSTETDGKKVNKRIGFIVESESTFLNADVLQFFQIRCYKKGEPVYSQLVDESNAVGVDLIGEAQSQKMRFSIEVPANIDFDEFALWTAGVLKLDISTLRI